MGMSASQARLIELTARMNDVEYEGQQINQQRQTLANKMNEIYNQAMTLEVPTAPSKIDFRTDAYSGKIGARRVDIKKNDDGNWSAIKTTRAWTCYNTTGKVGKGNVEGDLKVLVEAPATISIEDFNKYKAMGAIIADKDPKTGKFSPVKNEDGATQSIDQGTQQIQEGDKTVEIRRHIVIQNTSDYKVGDSATFDMSYAKLAFDNENFQNALKGLENYVKASGGTFKDSDYTVIASEDGTFKFVLKADLAEGKEISVLGSEEDTSAQVRLEVKEVRYDANGCVEKVTLIDDDGKEKTIDIGVNTAAYDDVAYDAAMREYEAKKIAYDYEQNEFNKRTSIYQQQDKQLELKLTRLDNERNALNTEIEAVKKVIQDAIDKGFKTFSG